MAPSCGAFVGDGCAALGPMGCKNEVLCLLNFNLNVISATQLVAATTWGGAGETI